MYDFMNDARVSSAGFYDEDGAWFYTYDAARPEEDYSYSCANTWDRSTQVVRLHGGREMSVADYRRMVKEA